jgi:hypothetical protein
VLINAGWYYAPNDAQISTSYHRAYELIFAR